MSDVITLTNFIDGKSVKPRSGKYIDSFNPATGKVFAKVISQVIRVYCDDDDKFQKFQDAPKKCHLPYQNL